MPLDWWNMDAEERAQAILDDIEGLSDADVQSILSAWKEAGTESETLLIRMAMDRLAEIGGAPTCAQRARASLKRRGVIE